MPARGFYVAIEGPCCAGKTTLGDGLFMRLSSTEGLVLYVQDYSDFVGGGCFLPRAVPATLEEETQALRTFLALEEARTAKARAVRHSGPMVIIDRSVYTLYAHCHALTEITGIDYNAVASAVLDDTRVPLRPDLVLYVDIDIATAQSRNNGKFPADSIFIDRQFNLGIRRYFQSLAGGGHPTVAWLDGTAGATLLLEAAMSHLRQRSATDSDSEEEEA